VKALSIRSPWWLAILDGGKDIENRNWRTNFRGRIYIHASKWFNGPEIMDDLCTIGKILDLEKPAVEMLELFKPFRGYLVGTVEIVDCVSKSDSPWFFGEYGFVLANPVALDKPIPFKGALGFFEVPDDVHVCEYRPLSFDEERRCFICQKLM
jgi:hypothetical protein